MPSSEYLLSRRNDLSGYLVHLTRDYNGKSAKANLHSMLERGKLEARNAYCLFSSAIKEMTSSRARIFRSVCFTETPLSELNYITQYMESRQIHLSQYGLVFGRRSSRAPEATQYFTLTQGQKKVESAAMHCGIVFGRLKKLVLEAILLSPFSLLLTRLTEESTFHGNANGELRDISVLT